MKFKKLDAPNYRAEKVSQTGAVYYAYWLNEQGDQYVQIVKVVGGGGAGTGSFSPDLFSVVDLGTLKQFNGHDPVTGATRLSSDNNMSGFLKAIRLDIARREQEERDI